MSTFKCAQVGKTKTFVLTRQYLNKVILQLYFSDLFLGKTVPYFRQFISFDFFRRNT